MQWMGSERGHCRPSRAEIQEYRQGSFHALETDQYAINIGGVRRKGSAILQTEPLHSMGKTLKAAHLGSIFINKALSQLPDDNGTETLTMES